MGCIRAWLARLVLPLRTTSAAQHMVSIVPTVPELARHVRRRSAIISARAIYNLRCRCDTACQPRHGPALYRPRGRSPYLSLSSLFSFFASLPLSLRPRGSLRTHTLVLSPPTPGLTDLFSSTVAGRRFTPCARAADASGIDLTARARVPVGPSVL